MPKSYSKYQNAKNQVGWCNCLDHWGEDRNNCHLNSFLVNWDLILIFGIQFKYFRKILLHDFDLGLLVRVCYPKRSSSPVSNFPFDLINGAWSFGILYTGHVSLLVDPEDTWRQVVLQLTSVDMRYCGRFKSIPICKSIFKITCHQLYRNY